MEKNAIAPNFSKPFNLRAKITLPYLFIAILITIGAGFLVTRIIFDTVEARFKNQLVESGKLASEGMVSEENRLLETVRLLANTNGVDWVIQTADSEALRSLTFGAIVNNQEEAVLFFDAAGNTILSALHVQGGNLEEYQFSKGFKADLNIPFIANVFTQQQDALGDKYSGIWEVGNTQYFFVSGPIEDEFGQLIGVVMVGKSLTRLAQELREATLAQITFYRTNGQVLASTFPGPQALDFFTAGQVIANQDSHSYNREQSQPPDVNSIQYDELLGPWEGRGDSDLGVIGVALTKSFLVSFTRVTRTQAILISAMAIVVIILVGLIISGLITYPIKRLVKASQRVAEGDLNVQLKPISNDEISQLTTSFNQMVRSLHQSKSALIKSYDETLEGWSKAMELRDRETNGHTERVANLTVKMAIAMGLSREEIIHIRRGALLHDIGKMGVPDHILTKNGQLTEEEFRIMQLHPIYAYNMLKNIDFLTPALVVPYSHHERWDGSGYPRGLKGEEIPLAARIFAIVDVWDALRSERPYRRALPDNEVIEIIRKKVGNHFDPAVAKVFMDMYEKGKL